MGASKKSYDVDTSSSGVSMFSKRFRFQCLATVIVHTLTLAQGATLGWLSPTLLLLQSTDSPLNFEVTSEDASWIGSMFGLGALAGNIFIGVTVSHFSRKFLMYLVAIPAAVSWILFYFAANVEYLYIARFINGMTSGSHYITMAVYLSEIANPGIRGGLSAFAMVTAYFGVFMGFFLTSLLSYHVTPWIIFIFPIVYFLGITQFPETPQYLLRHNRFEESETSYRFYNNIKDKTKDSDPEVQAILEEFEELKTAIVKERESYTKLTLKDFFNKRAMSAFLTAFILISLNQFSGSYGLISYMVNVFEEMGSALDSKLSSNIMGVIQIFGSIFFIAVIDRLGRRTLMFISASGLAVCLLVTGLYSSLLPEVERDANNWVPLLLIGVNVFFTSLGVGPSILVMIVEILPVKIRSIGTSMCMALFSITQFVAMKIYLDSLNILGVATTMYITFGATIVCSAYLVFFLKEMKGKSIDVDE